MKYEPREHVIDAELAGGNPDAWRQALGLRRPAFAPIYKPTDCPHCEYDRRFPGFEGGGWMQQDNNGPIVSCPMCNDDGAHPQLPQESKSE